jgi:hypothetical protein
MSEVPQQHVTREEVRESCEKEALIAWTEHQATGLH